MSTPAQHPADLPEGRLLYLDPRVLLSHPLNIRHDIGDVTDLAESLKTGGIGLVEPIVVVPVEDGYRMVGGHRRCTAAILAELPTVPCFERPGLADSDPDQIAAVIAFGGLFLFATARSLSGPRGPARRWLRWRAAPATRSPGRRGPERVRQGRRTDELDSGIPRHTRTRPGQRRARPSGSLGLVARRKSTSER